MSFHVDLSVNPYEDSMSAIPEAISLNQQALQLERSGDFQGAERLHIRALEIKERAAPRHVTTAITLNALGELYLKLDRLAEAETYLNRAIDIRGAVGSKFDFAVSRENLAQVYEKRGHLQRAKEIRLESAPNVCCSNYKCPGQLFSLDRLQQCSRCKVGV
ncbi:hypothetical protein OE88DRAFT_1650632 [Heliocybe sulcata]|uniref:Uncharacterized protein n=1 Tax=Heliocybe sulcata TaxID=5364 RepID=A0A5C3NLP0_9AGAM|nr:hypothetical protein OE88DRAFT_1650632 [Heliocybe sulcata]